MKLLIDGAFSPRLVDRLADVYPGSMHVERGMKSTPDRTVLQVAGLMDSVLVTPGAEFDDLAMLDPDAGRVLRLDLGPGTTDEIERVLRAIAADLPELFVAVRQVTVTPSAGEPQVSGEP